MTEPTKRLVDESKDTQPKIQGDGNVIGDKSTSQVVKAFRSAVKNVVQVAGDLVVSVPTWGLIATAVILVVGLVLAAGVFNIPTLRELIPTPIPITPCQFSPYNVPAVFTNIVPGVFGNTVPAVFTPNVPAPG
jgi:hypothetical protein